jgi:hypothetical protein
LRQMASTHDANGPVVKLSDYMNNIVVSKKWRRKFQELGGGKLHQEGPPPRPTLKTLPRINVKTG